MIGITRIEAMTAPTVKNWQEHFQHSEVSSGIGR
jgi:hypothetical protein